MRTTLVIKDALLAEAKKRAADRKSNVSAIVNEALEKAFREGNPVQADPNFRISVYQPESGKTVDSDAAALAIENAAIWITRDTDFQAFTPHGLQLNLWTPTS